EIWRALMRSLHLHDGPQLIGALVSKVKSRGHHSDDDEVFLVDSNALPNCLRSASKMLAPELVAHNHGKRLPDSIFPRRKGSTEHRFDAQHSKKMRSDFSPGNFFGLAIAGQREPIGRG